MSLDTDGCPQQKEYDYLLKFLLVGDSDVGKQEMLNDLEDGSSDSPYCSGSGNIVFFFPANRQYNIVFMRIKRIKWSLIG